MLVMEMESVRRLISIQIIEVIPERAQIGIRFKKRNLKIFRFGRPCIATAICIL